MESRCQLGEGLLITPSGERWWLDIPKKRLFRWKAGDICLFELPEMASKVLGVDEDSIILASESGITHFHQHTRSFEVVHAAPPVSWKGAGRSNDACYLPDGSILVGRLDFNPRPHTGDVVRYTEMGCEIVLENIAIPNTFVCLNDRQSILISDSLSKCTYECDLPMCSGQTLRRRLWKDFSGHAGTPDGGTLGVDGNVHIAMWGAACVAKLSSCGEILNEEPIPALKPTSIQFDNLRQAMVVTTAAEHMTHQQLVDYPQSGYIYSYSV